MSKMEEKGMRKVVPWKITQVWFPNVVEVG